MKSALAPKRLGTTVYGINIIYFFNFPRELNIFFQVATATWAPEVNIGWDCEVHEQTQRLAPAKPGARAAGAARETTGRRWALPATPSTEGLL